MRVTTQKQVLPIKNYDVPSIAKQYVKHGVLLGEGCKRGLLVGGSGCGKTNVMLSLLEHVNGLRFENVYIYSKSLFQPKYEYLRKLLKPIRGLGYYEYEDGTQIMPPKDAKNNSVFIFDDVVCDTQSVIRDYFCFGRHKSIDCFYLSQTYSSIPKQLIRDNANLIVIFKQDNTNLKHIYNDHVNVDMSFDEFKNLCSYCWKNKYGFLVIDKDSEISSGRYRKGFDCYIHL
jgi:hypothetical protein